MINLQRCPDGVLLPVRAMPGACKAEIRGEHGGALKVAVTQVAEKGKANKALAALLCKSLGLRRSQIELVSGETSANKVFLVRDMLDADLAAKITGILSG